MQEPAKLSVKTNTHELFYINIAFVVLTGVILVGFVNYLVRLPYSFGNWGMACFSVIAFATLSVASFVVQQKRNAAGLYLLWNAILFFLVGLIFMVASQELRKSPLAGIFQSAGPILNVLSAVNLVQALKQLLPVPRVELQHSQVDTH